MSAFIEPAENYDLSNCDRFYKFSAKLFKVGGYYTFFFCSASFAWAQKLCMEIRPVIADCPVRIKRVYTIYVVGTVSF